MKSFIIIGLGRFGSNVARTLSESGNEVLAIDAREDRVSRIVDDVTHAIVGNATDESVLKSIGVRNFDCAIVSLSDDMQGCVLVTMLLKELGCPFVVSKATSELHMRILEKVGADKVVYPEKDMGMKLAMGLAQTNVLEFIEMSDDYMIAEIETPLKWVGHTLKELGLRKTVGINVMAIKDNETRKLEISIDLDVPFKKGDTLIILGRTDAVKSLTHS